MQSPNRPKRLPQETPQYRSLSAGSDAEADGAGRRKQHARGGSARHGAQLAALPREPRPPERQVKRDRESL